VRVVRDAVTSLGRGYAYVCFEKREGAKAAAELEGVKIGGRLVRIERCKKPAKEGEEKPSATKKARVAPPKVKKGAAKKVGTKKGPPQPKMPQRQRKKLNKAK
jgi:nucleolar protein 12